MRRLLRKLYILWIRLIHRKSEWKKHTPVQKQLFEEIQPGDIITAWMPLSEKRMLKMQESHRRRPFYVIEKKEDSLICFSGTSRNDPSRSDRRIPILQKDYNVWKDGFLCTDRVKEIPIDCLINRLDTLSSETMSEVNRKIAVVYHNTGNKAPLFPVLKKLKKGDVIFFKGAYWYVGEYKRNLCGYMLNISRADLKNTLFNRDILKNRSIALDETIDSFRLMWICSEEQKKLAEFVIRQYQESQRIQPKEKKPFVNDHYYRYPVGQYFDDWYQQNRFIYLFSCNSCDYGVYEDEYMEDQLILRSRKCSKMNTIGRLADEDQMTDILNWMICSDEKKYGWLNELLV